MATCYRQLGVLAQERGDLSEADGWMTKALTIFEALGDRSKIAGSCHQLGIIAQRTGRIPEAEGWHRKSLAIRETLGNKPDLAASYTSSAWLRGYAERRRGGGLV